MREVAVLRGLNGAPGFWGIWWLGGPPLMLKLGLRLALSGGFRESA